MEQTLTPSQHKLYDVYKTKSINELFDLLKINKKPSVDSLRVASKILIYERLIASSESQIANIEEIDFKPLLLLLKISTLTEILDQSTKYKTNFIIEVEKELDNRRQNFIKYSNPEQLRNLSNEELITIIELSDSLRIKDRNFLNEEAQLRNLIADNKELKDIINLPKPIGIAGWLILPAIGLIISLLFNLIYCFYQIQNTDIKSIYLNLYLVFESLILFSFSIPTTNRFFNKSRKLPKTMTILLLLGVILEFLPILLFSNDSSSTSGLVRFIVTLITSIIWIIYFNTSTRVWYTYKYSYFKKTIEKEITNARFDAK